MEIVVKFLAVIGVIALMIAVAGGVGFVCGRIEGCEWYKRIKEGKQ